MRWVPRAMMVPTACEMYVTLLSELLIWLPFAEGKAGAGGTPKHTLRRTRNAVEDRKLRQLAGVEPYQVHFAA